MTSIREINPSSRRVSGYEQRRIIIALLIQFALMTLACIDFLIYQIAHLHGDATVWSLCLVLVLTVAWAVFSWRWVSGTLFDPYGIFLVAAFLFNGGQALLEVLNLNYGGLLQGKYGTDTLVVTVRFVTLCLIAMHLGALLAKLLTRNWPRNIDSRARLIVTGKSLRLVGWSLLLISSVPTAILLGRAILVVMSGGYGALYEQQAQTSFAATPQVISAFVVPSALFCLAGHKGSRLAIPVSGLIILVYTIIQLFLGARAAASMPVVAYAWVYDRTVRPIPKTMLMLAAAFILFIVFPLVGTTRNVGGQYRSSASYLSEAFISLDTPGVYILSEMGGSMLATASTIELVPSSRPYDNGLSYAYASSTVIPNFSGGVHMAIQHGTPSAWLVETLDPGTAARGGGYGYSFIAESYLNFGWYGFVFIGIIGFSLARFSLWAVSGCDFARIAFVGSMLAFFLVSVRAESAVVFRPLIWYCLLPYVVARFLSNRQ